MRETRRNLLVGVFMIGGLGVLGFLMVMFGEAPSWLGGAEYVVHIRVTEIREVAGVDEGTPIYLNSIKIGRVEALRFMDMSAPQKGLEIVGKIERRFIVPRGARAICYGPTLGFGRGRVEVRAEASEGPAVEPGGSIQGQMANALEKIIPDTLVSSLEITVERIGEFAKTLTPVAEDLHEILKKAPLEKVDDPRRAERVTANLFTAVQRLDQALKHFNDVLGDPAVKSGLRESVENVRVMTAEGRDAFGDLRETSANLKTDAARITEKLEGTVENINRRVDQVADAALPVLDNSAKTTANLRLLTANLVEGKGSLGKLLHDNRLYEILVLSLERAKDVFDSLSRLGERFEKKGRIGLDVNGWLVDRKIP